MFIPNLSLTVDLFTRTSHAKHKAYKRRRKRPGLSAETLPIESKRTGEGEERTKEERSEMGEEDGLGYCHSFNTAVGGIQRHRRLPMTGKDRTPDDGWDRTPAE